MPLILVTKTSDFAARYDTMPSTQIRTMRKGAMLRVVGEASPLLCPIHPHMLRHSTGYKLANDGRDTRALQHYLGHRNIQHTVRYCELASGRFEGWWG